MTSCIGGCLFLQVSRHVSGKKPRWEEGVFALWHIPSLSVKNPPLLRGILDDLECYS